MVVGKGAVEDGNGAVVPGKGAVVVPLGVVGPVPGNGDGPWEDPGKGADGPGKEEPVPGNAGVPVPGKAPVEGGGTAVLVGAETGAGLATETTCPLTSCFWNGNGGGVAIARPLEAW